MLTPADGEALAAASGDPARLRALIAARREAIRLEHARHRCGGETVAALTALMDAVLRALYRQVVVAGDALDRPGSGCAVVAVGG